MTVEEAHALLDEAFKGKDLWKPSKVNPQLTRYQAIEIVKAGLKFPGGGGCVERYVNKLTHLGEKRVWQVVRNQRNPRF